MMEGAKAFRAALACPDTLDTFKVASFAKPPQPSSLRNTHNAGHASNLLRAQSIGEGLLGRAGHQ